jgi:hypothetical protein
VLALIMPPNRPAIVVSVTDLTGTSAAVSTRRRMTTPPSGFLGIGGGEERVLASLYRRGASAHLPAEEWL